MHLVNLYYFPCHLCTNCCKQWSPQNPSSHFTPVASSSHPSVQDVWIEPIWHYKNIDDTNLNLLFQDLFIFAPAAPSEIKGAEVHKKLPALWC